MDRYNFKVIEEKWQTYWDKNKFFKAKILKDREKFYKAIGNSQSNLILAGDSHNSWISNLFNKNNKFIGIEIGAPSISSPNFIDTFGKYTDACH